MVAKPSEASSWATVSSTSSDSMNSCGAGGEFLLAAFGFLGLGQDVDLPAGELGGEAHILAAAADAQRNCSSGTTTSTRWVSSSSTTLVTSAGARALTMKVAGLAVPRNDVDALALQFLHHRLHAHAAHADAGADRIDAGILGDHGDLGAAARIAGHGADLDHAVIDFRHFLGEQAHHELGMAARQENLRPAGFAAHVIDIGADAVAGAEALARDHLVAAHHAFGACPDRPPPSRTRSA